MVVLARRYYVTKATITSVVDELERKGLVNRRRSEEDRRTVFVELTQHGREVFRRGVELFKELSDEMLEGIDGIQEINEKLGEILKRVEET
jgi:DNA-binding MarR family transcriptional regulator